MEAELQRWSALSIGLAQHWSISLTPARREKLVNHVREVIEEVIDTASSERSPIVDWDGGNQRGGFHVSDFVNDYLWDHRLLIEGRDGEEPRGRLGNQISCCVRAGLDVAGSPSGGVIGFNLGDLRRACGGVLPPWVRAYFDLSDGADLDYMDDAEGLWL